MRKDDVALCVGEPPIEEVSSLYCTFRRQLRDHDELVLETLLAMLRMPSDAFANRCEAAFVAEDDLERTVFEDCSAYYSVLSEIYHKVSVICDYFELDDEPGDSEFSLVNDAVCGAGDRIVTRADIPDALVGYLTDELIKYAKQYEVVESLLFTPTVIPQPLTPFKSIRGLMDYYLTAADTILCLVYFRDPQCLIRSGYLDEQALRVEGIEFILNEMRDQLFANTRKMLEVSC